MSEEIPKGTLTDVRSRPSGLSPESSQAALRLKRVAKIFPTADRGSSGIYDINMEVARGEMICIVGPSGCGKSTILNLVAGLLTPDLGEIEFGKTLGDAIRARRIGYMLARDSLLPWRTARGNVELALEVGHKADMSRSQRRDRARELLNLVGLKAFGDHFPGQLSHGMRQRTAIARTLACNPAIFLMDEPFGALDAQTKRVLQEEFLRIWSMDKKTVLFVTHDLMEALILGDRVIVITGRPGTITADYFVDIPREQRLGAHATTPRLLELHESLWRDLRGTEHAL